MAQASRSKAKSKPRTRSSNGSHETATARHVTTALLRSDARSTCWRLSRGSDLPHLRRLPTQARCTRTAGFRLLRTLEARGFAIQDEARGMWRLGARWGVLGRAAAEQGALAATAMPFLAALGKTGRRERLSPGTRRLGE